MGENDKDDTSDLNAAEPPSSVRSTMEKSLSANPKVSVNIEHIADSEGQGSALNHQSNESSNTGLAAKSGNMKRSTSINFIMNQINDDREMTEEEQFYVSGVFSIESSPAFKALESMRGHKNISDSKLNELKEKVKSLHKYLLSFHEYEKSMQKRTKQMALELSQQRIEIDRTETTQFSNNVEMGTLKRELHKSENEVKLAMERESKRERDIEELSQQRADLNADIEDIRRHKAELLEPQLIAGIKEFKTELGHRKVQLDNLERDLQEKEIQCEILLEDTERLELEREKHMATLARSSEMPIKILKQSEVLRDAITSLVSENVKQTTLSQQFDSELERLAKRKKELAEMKLDQAADYEENRANNNDIEGECDNIFKEHELARDQLSVQLAEKVKLDLALKNAVNTIKIEHDALLRAIRDKELQLKQHRRLETVLNNVSMSTPQILQQLEDCQIKLALRQREEKIEKQNVVTLKKEIDMCLFEFLKSEGGAKSERDKMIAQKELNRSMELELEKLIHQKTELTRTIDALVGECELKARDLIRIQSKHKSIMDDVNLKKMSISEASKRCTESVNRLKEFSMLYDVVKNERNKYVNQIQAATQRAAEMKEKIRILSNEIEILRHEIMNKDRELTKKKQENFASYAIRDSAKNDANKLLATYRERREQIDQHLSRIETLNVLINSAEEDMKNIKNRYERAIKDRNSVGIQLLDRNDELCIIYERYNVQANIALKGESALLEREEDLRRLSVIKSELVRKLELSKKKLPDVTNVKTRVSVAEKELEQCRARMTELGEKMENSDDPARCRDLKGSDPNETALMQKIRNIELQLAEREERLLEKDLILEEVSTLTTRLKKQAIEGRQESHEVAVKMNDLSKKLKSVTRSIMARVSELAMYQAMSMGLYQEKCEKEALVEEAKLRMARGEMPTEEIEKEFIRLERQRIAKEKELNQLRERQEREKAPNYVEIDQDAFYTYNNMRTMAEPRPNAYIPSSTGMGDLPIPKPYGAHAPFKPKDVGSQIRHYRKPTLRPVEL